ncbi:MAG: hypothetical protein U5L11_05865 [Arhodomonas sp.]|nr:hypothetical protein [Arhodomonas sp.]
MIRTFGALLLLPLLALPVAAVAMEDVEERIRDVVAGLAPGANVDRIEETPVEGLYSVVVGARWSMSPVMATTSSRGSSWTSTSSVR